MRLRHSLRSLAMIEKDRASRKDNFVMSYESCVLRESNTTVITKKV